MEAELKNKLEFSHAFQPIVDIKLKQIKSYEVLVRGKNKEPAIKVFETINDNHFIEFDNINRKQAITLVSKLGLECSLNLNFTPNSILFENGKYVKDTIATAEKQGISPRQIILEITECEIIKNSYELLKVINKIRRLGITIAIDDFGSGYAGLNLLADFQPDLIKLDMHLTRNIHQNGPRQSILKAICTVCLDLGIDLLAEGVETKEEFLFLQKLGIYLYQGYFFAKPKFESLLNNKEKAYLYNKISL